MKYMLLITASDRDDKCDEPSFEEWMAYDKSVQDAGIFVAGHALADLVTETNVVVTRGGERVVTDGPFAETREVLGGYYVIDVPDLDVAIDWAGRCPGAKDGVITIRPVADFEQ